MASQHHLRTSTTRPCPERRALPSRAARNLRVYSTEAERTPCLCYVLNLQLPEQRTVGVNRALGCCRTVDVAEQGVRSPAVLCTRSVARLDDAPGHEGVVVFHIIIGPLTVVCRGNPRDEPSKACGARYVHHRGQPWYWAWLTTANHL